MSCHAKVAIVKTYIFALPACSRDIAMRTSSRILLWREVQRFQYFLRYSQNRDDSSLLVFKGLREFKDGYRCWKAKGKTCTEQHNYRFLLIKQQKSNGISVDKWERQNENFLAILSLKYYTFPFQKCKSLIRLFVNIIYIFIFSQTKAVMDSQLIFCTLKRQDLEDALSIILAANRNTNPNLIHNCQTLQSFEEQTRNLIDSCFENQHKYNALLGRDMEYNYGLRSNGKLVAVMLSLDFIQERIISQSLLLNTTHPLHQFGVELNSLDFEGLRPGTATYFTRLSVLPEVTRRGVGVRLLYEACKYQLANGYAHSFIIAIVEASLRLFSSLGGQLLRHFEEERSAFRFQINIVKNDFGSAVKAYERFDMLKNKQS